MYRRNLHIECEYFFTEYQHCRKQKSEIEKNARLFCTTLRGYAEKKWRHSENSTFVHILYTCDHCSLNVFNLYIEQQKSNIPNLLLQQFPDCANSNINPALNKTKTMLTTFLIIIPTFGRKSVEFVSRIKQQKSKNDVKKTVLIYIELYQGKLETW